MSYCQMCGRNKAKAGRLSWFKKLNPKQRSSSIKAIRSWLKTFIEVHKKLIAESR